MKKILQKVIISIILVLVLLTFFFQAYFCLLTYSILNESTGSNGNYAESKYRDRIDSQNYRFFNLFRQDEEVYETIRNERYYTYLYIAIPNNLSKVKVYYMYSIHYEVKRAYSEKYISPSSAWINCTVTWEYQDGWKIVDYYEPA